MRRVNDGFVVNASHNNVATTNSVSEKLLEGKNPLTYLAVHNEIMIIVPTFVCRHFFRRDNPVSAGVS